MQSQQIEVDDVVNLTGFTILQLSKSSPELFKALSENCRTSGKVTEVNANFITVDLGEDSPLRIDVPYSHIDQAVQLIKKGDQAQQPVFTVADNEACPAAQRQSAGQEQPQSIFGSPLQAFIARLPLAQFPSQPPAAQEEVPTRVRTAQWVMVQILSLKQYGIVQDLNRTPDQAAPLPDPTGSNWDKTQLRAVHVELSPAEEKLYMTALQTIGCWITDPTMGPPPVAHPEATEDKSDVVPLDPPEPE